MQESLQTEQKSIVENLSKINQSISLHTAEQSVITKRIAELEDRLKKNISSQHATTSSLRRGNTENYVRKIENDLTLVFYGIKESEQSDYQQRFLELKNSVAEILEKLNCSLETNVTYFQRLGKFSTQKNRPVLLKLNSVWTKRTILSEFEKAKSEGTFVHPQLKISTYRIRTGTFEAAKKKAWTMNEAEKQTAESENSMIKTSYSAQQNGDINVFKLTDGDKWVKESVIKANGTLANNSPQ